MHVYMTCVLYYSMTVKEHMEFYSNVKDSYNAISRKDEIRQYVTHLTVEVENRISLWDCFIVI